MSDTILYQNGAFTVRPERRIGRPDIYAVYEDGATAAARVAVIGYEGEDGRARAIAECDRRAAGPATDAGVPLPAGERAATFAAELERQFTRLWGTPEYAPAARQWTPGALAVRFTHYFATGAAVSKDGAGVKATCKALGIKHTYKAIAEYLKGGDNASHEA